MAQVIDRLRDWLTWKWRPQKSEELIQAYVATFSTTHGRMVLHDMFDRLYCQVCESNDPVDIAVHNAKRAVIHEILWNIQLGEKPHLIHPVVIEEDPHAA